MNSPRFLLTKVRKGGLEPPRPKPLDPKSSASTNSATLARISAAKYRQMEFGLQGIWGEGDAQGAGKCLPLPQIAIWGIGVTRFETLTKVRGTRPREYRNLFPPQSGGAPERWGTRATRSQPEVQSHLYTAGCSVYRSSSDFQTTCPIHTI
jgi:hypothetical protein